MEVKSIDLFKLSLQFMKTAIGLTHSGQYLFLSVESTSINVFAVGELCPHQRIHDVVEQAVRRQVRYLVSNNCVFTVPNQPVFMVPGFQKKRELRSLVDEVNFVVRRFLVNNVAIPYLSKQNEI